MIKLNLNKKKFNKKDLKQLEKVRKQNEELLNRSDVGSEGLHKRFTI